MNSLRISHRKWLIEGCLIGIQSIPSVKEKTKILAMITHLREKKEKLIT